MLKRFLLNLDVGFFGALYRVLIGFSTVPAMRLLLGRDGSDWILAPFLVFVLLLLRVGLMIVRKLAPFSAELQEAWAARRRKAKVYDSYQWRKLVWIGAGLACYMAVSGQYWPLATALSVFCLIAGVAGAMRWRVVSANGNSAKEMARKIESAAA